VVFCLPSIQAGGGTVLNLISQRKSGIPPKPPFRFSFSQTERERKQAGKNSFPPTPFLFARLLWLRPQNFSADGRRDIKLGGNSLGIAYHTIFYIKTHAFQRIATLQKINFCKQGKNRVNFCFVFRKDSENNCKFFININTELVLY